MRQFDQLYIHTLKENGSNTEVGKEDYAIMVDNKAIYEVGSIIPRCPFEGNENVKIIGIEERAHDVYFVHLATKDEGYTHIVFQKNDVAKTDRGRILNIKIDNRKNLRLWRDSMKKHDLKDLYDF